LNPKRHIVGTTGDGAAVMVLFGQLIDSDYFLCPDHTIQLGVTDMLFEPPKRSFDSSESHQINESSDSDSSDNESSSDGSDEEDLIKQAKEFVLKKPFKPVIDKIRKIITHFNKSPRQSEILQDYIEEELHIRLQLIKDSIILK
jgi:hypothetical protein